MSDCKHKTGDTINGIWVCASCYEKLHSRPQRYDLVRVRGDGNVGEGAYRQQIVWRAGVAICDGVTFGTFVACMARRLMAQTQGSMDKNDATDYAIEILRTLGEPFGAKDMSWDQGGAWDLVDEDMTHWDADERASN